MGRGYLAAIGTVVGTIVGAGVLALPYAISKSGFIIGIALLIIVGISSILITMYTGELSFRLKKLHQLPVLISKYVGKKFRFFILILQVLTIYGAILAYLIAMGVSLNALLGIPYILSVLLVFAFSVPIIHQGYKLVEDAETPLSIIKLVFLVIVSLIVLFAIKPGNLATINVGNSLAPFGVILFALIGYSVVPEVREELNNNSKDFNKVVIISTVTAIAVYILFAAAFIGDFGSGISSIATNALSSGQFGFLYYLLTIFLVITPYIALSLVMVDAFNYDFSIKRSYSFWLTMMVPVILALIGFNFAHVLEVIGGVLLPILSVMILVAVYRERRLSGRSMKYSVPGGVYLLLFTAAVMIVGFIYTILYVVL
jgi:amino acid permease